MAWADRPHIPGWAKLRAHVLRRDRGLCQINGDHCTHRATEVDHITNWASGGTHYPNNLQAACRPCHRAKTTREAVAARPSERRPTPKHPGLL